MSAKRKVDDTDEDFIARTLECSLCNRMLNNPKQLPECGHCFCYTCLLNYYDREQQKQAMSSPESECSNELVCPKCELPNELGSRAIEEIPTNAPLLALSHRFRKKLVSLKRKAKSPVIENSTPLRNAAQQQSPLNSGQQTSSSATENLENSEILESPPSLQIATEIKPEVQIQLPNFLQQSMVPHKNVNRYTNGCLDSENIHNTPTANTNSGSGSASPPMSTLSCCSFFEANNQTRTQCKHCFQQFCKRCELLHLEIIRSEIAELGQSLVERMGHLPSAEIVSEAASDVFNKMTYDLENVEREIAATAFTVHTGIKTSIDQNIQRLIANANNIVHSETKRIEKLIEKWSRLDWRNDVLKQVRDACQEIKSRPLINQSLDAVSPIFTYLNKLKGDVEDVEKLCQPIPTESQLSFSISPQFSTTVASIGNDLDMGSIVSLINETTTPLPVAVPDMFVLNPTPTPSDSPNGFIFSKDFYDNLSVTSVFRGMDKFGWSFKKPSACCLLALPKPVALVIHNGTRLSMINASGEMTASYRIRLHPEEKEECYLGQCIAASDDGTIFLLCHYNRRILYLNYHDIKNPKNAYARVLVRHPPEDESTFNALAVCSQRGEVYTSTRDSIIAYFTSNGTESFRCAFQDPSQIGTSFLKTVFADGDGKPILVYTSMNGKVAYTIRLPGSGSLDDSESSASMLPLSKQVRTVSPTSSFVASSLSNHIKYITTDPSGNFLVSLSNNSRILVFESSSEDPFSEIFSPGVDSNSFVVIPGENPVIVTACFHSNSVAIFGLKK